MDPLNDLTRKIIGCAMEVHRVLGPGLLESAYERALGLEFGEANLDFKSQLHLPALYKGLTVGEYRIDFLVGDSVVVEIKSVERWDPVFEAQILTYLKIARKRLGLFINFNSRLLRDGLKRYIL